MDGYAIRRLGWMAWLALAAGSVHAQSAPALRVELQAAGSFARAYEWSIDKAVTPAAADRFIGEHQALAYRLTVTRGAPQDSSFRVSGRAVIANDGTSSATVASIALSYGG